MRKISVNTISRLKIPFSIEEKLLSLRLILKQENVHKANLLQREFKNGNR